MVRSMLRAGAWPAVTGVSGTAVVVGGCGVAFPAAATVLFAIAFTLLAAAAAFTLDEPASQVVDVTPTGPVRRIAIRSLALLAPLTAGAVLMLAGAQRGLALLLLGAPFWWGFNLRFAWLNAAVVLTFLILAWTAQKASPRSPSGDSRSSA